MTLLKKGQRVVRGLDWCYGTQDGKPLGTYNRCSGVVLQDQESEDMWIDVRWDSGYQNCYQHKPGRLHIIPILAETEGRQYLLDLK